MGMMTDPDRIAALLQSMYPDLIVSRNMDNSGPYIAIHPHRIGHPQVNIHWDWEGVKWQGYWGEIRWGYPFGYGMGMKDMNYVIPTKYGRGTKAIKLDIHDIDTEGRLLAMTEDWFREHPPAEGHGKYPEVPEGFRLATEDEIKAARD